MYATIVGLPCVPEDACTRTVCSSGTASIPNGNASRSSLFVVNGSSSRAGSSPTSRSFSRFGAAPGKTRAFDPDSDDPRQREFARHIVRYAEKQPVWDAGFARLVYVGEGGAPPGQYRMDMVHLPKGAGVRGYSRPVEDAYFVTEGCITVGWEESGHVVEERVGPKDVILNPAG